MRRRPSDRSAGWRVKQHRRIHLDRSGATVGEAKGRRVRPIAARGTGTETRGGGSARRRARRVSFPRPRGCPSRGSSREKKVYAPETADLACSAVSSSLAAARTRNGLAFLACLPVFAGARTRAGAIAERAPSDSMVERTRVVRVGVYGCRLVEKPSEITSDDETIDTRRSRASQSASHSSIY